jgi:hypothetical protein
VALGSGVTVQLADMPRFRTEGYGLTAFKFPNVGGAAGYVHAHARDGDVVLANDPFQVNYLMGRLGRPERAVHFWPESKLRFPATLGDGSSLPRDRRDGTTMVPDLESLQALFARHGRVWYVVQPERHGDLNVAEVSLFLQLNMDVVYEDCGVLVLLRDDNRHRPASSRRQNEQALGRAQAEYLP